MTTRLGILELTSGQLSLEIDHNEALHLIDALIGGVLDRNVGTTPASPAEGDAYIVDQIGGNWSGFTIDDVAIYFNGAWKNYSPVEGMSVYIVDEDLRVLYDGTDWVVETSALSLITDSTTSRNFALTDAFKYIRFTNAGAITATVDPDSTTNFDMGVRIDCRAAGAGAVTITAGSGVTINNTGGLASAAQHESCTLIKVAANTWDLVSWA